MLTALSLAVKEYFKVDKIAIMLEGHGRENIHADSDISRTIGWFTTKYPVIFDMQFSDNVIRQLIEIKEAVKKTPNKGIGYGILRYLKNKKYKMNPEITFNYLGDFGSSVSNNHDKQLFEFSDQDRGGETSGEMKCDSAFIVSGLQVNDKIRLSISVSCKQFQEGTIDEFVLIYKNKIESLVDMLSTEDSVYLTPADLTFKGLTMEDIALLSKL